MDSNAVCLKKEMIQHMLVTDRVQNWNLHYKPAFELHMMQW